MSFIQNFYTSRDNNTDGSTYVGQEGRLWYNPNTNSIYVNAANVVGGTPVSLATGANITANILTVNTITSQSGTVALTGNITISGNISPAAAGKVGGIQPGPGVVIANDGTLTIDTANLPLSFGNFTASNNVLSIVNVDEDMILETNGDAEIQLVGNIGFYKPDGIPPNVSNRYAFFNNDGQVTFYVPAADLTGAVNFVGSSTGDIIDPGLTGAILHITGQLGIPSRFYQDGNGDYVAWVARRWNGNVATPTQVLANQDILRINATAATDAGVGNVAMAQIRASALENQTTTAQGSSITFTVTPIGSPASARVDVANVTVANGVSATKFTTSGNVTAGNVNTGNISLTGNVIGNIITGGVVSATGNIIGGNILTGGLISVTGGITSADGVNATGNLVVGNVIRYDQATNNAIANGFNKTGGTVTANGRTGQLTSLADLLAKGAAGTFTVNNNYITSAKDIVVINLASGGSTNSYSVAVTAINSAGSFQVTVTNNRSGGLSEALVFNFAVLKVS